ncbi:myelin-oligodendrocyte glycoprotein-like [Embiotoca jacksoni]|uniref:myelin-oligodendrocyte glycoprotein-like n=1 Tax=Embiotoca jacksoni TaxID=100190 RepID=UPI0037038776
MLMFTSDRNNVFSSFPLWTFTLCFALVGTPVKGESRVICQTELVVVAPGDDVILPCYVEPAEDARRLTVEWSKPDLKPDRLGRVEYVHLNRNGRVDRHMKLAAYVGRTEILAAELARGNVSLKIRNVTASDDGRYRCYLPKFRNPADAPVVRLSVESNSFKRWTTESWLVTRELPAPDPAGGAVSAGRIRLFVVIPLLLLFITIIIIIILAAIFTYFCKQKPETQAAPFSRS